MNKYVDFEIIKEDWNKYELQDGTKLKTRLMLKRVKLTQNAGQIKHNLEIDHITIFLCDPKMQGKPDTTRYTQKQLQANIEVTNCPYTTLRYEPYEYELDDGTRLVLHNTLVNIARTRLFDVEGNRYYVANITNQVTVTPPKSE